MAEKTLPEDVATALLRLAHLGLYKIAFDALPFAYSLLGPDSTPVDPATIDDQTAIPFSFQVTDLNGVPVKRQARIQLGGLYFGDVLGPGGTPAVKGRYLSQGSSFVVVDTDANGQFAGIFDAVTAGDVTLHGVLAGPSPGCDYVVGGGIYFQLIGV